LVCTVIGGTLLLVGWIGVSGTPYLAEQVPYIISGGVGGVFFLGIGATLWISADLRDEWRKLDRIEEALVDGTLQWTESYVSAPPAFSGDSDPTASSSATRRTTRTVARTSRKLDSGS
jgi:hypothetical protein